MTDAYKTGDDGLRAPRESAQDRDLQGGGKLRDPTEHQSGLDYSVILRAGDRHPYPPGEVVAHRHVSGRASSSKRVRARVCLAGASPTVEQRRGQ
ncbi:unnamed protein product [Schistocephalus solidus]|uniref:AMP_N domain-containing protein n=1 Tax=Schistocephalus solidus TaxID=70667 RepID=A0A183T7T4_SCHSO|nr:unnamed protein product [Schistocephalus solidus]